jgi:hypothetical protein
MDHQCNWDFFFADPLVFSINVSTLFYLIQNLLFHYSSINFFLFLEIDLNALHLTSLITLRLVLIHQIIVTKYFQLQRRFLFEKTVIL